MSSCQCGWARFIVVICFHEEKEYEDDGRSSDQVLSGPWVSYILCSVVRVELYRTVVCFFCDPYADKVTTDLPADARIKAISYAKVSKTRLGDLPGLRSSVLFTWP